MSDDPGEPPMSMSMEELYHYYNNNYYDGLFDNEKMNVERGHACNYDDQCVSPYNCDHGRVGHGH